MNRIRIYRGMLVCFLCLLLTGLFGVPVCGEGEIQTVKVGYFQMDGFNEIGEDGIYSGYDYDFFQLLSRYTSYNFVFTGYDKSWQEMQEMLSDGEIDILTSMHMTEDRKGRYSFSYDIGSSYTMLTVKMGNNNFQSGDYESYEGMKVGMLRESSQNTVFESFAQEKGFTYQSVYFDNTAELSEAVQAGTVDAALTSSLRRLSAERVIEEISPDNFYAVVRKGEQELLDEINQGITQMDLYEGDWRNNLYYEYYGYQDSSDTDITYSGREQSVLLQYTGDGQTLRVCFNPTLEPYSFVEDGTMKGILPDVIGELMDSWGINYEFVIADSYEEYQRILENGAADIFPEMCSDTSALAQEKYLFTDTYFTMKAGALSNKSLYNGLSTIAILKSQSFFQNLNMPNVSVVECDSLEQLLNVLESGKADLAYLMNYTAQMYVNRKAVGDLSYVSVPDLSYALCFAVNKELPHEFCSIFNKNIPALTAMDLYSLSLTYIENDHQDLSLMEYLQVHPITALFLFLLAIVLVVALMVLIFINLQNAKAKRINAEREAEREKQRKELQEALDAAQSANNAKTVFLSNMSHDIRTPMNAIIGFSTLAAKHIDHKERVEDYLSKISSASNHLLSLINDVLDMSRIEGGRIHLDEERCSLKELLRNIGGIISSDLQTAELNYSCDIVNVTDDMVFCDRLRLNQVLLNLLGNAIKFTQPGGSVHLSLTEWPGTDPDTASYEFRVRDTGIGMSEMFLEHVFEPFEREQTSTVSGIQGTGLGMTISKNIVEMMGGTITVSSQKGKGSEFVATIPMKKAGEFQAEYTSCVQEKTVSSAEKQEPIQGKRILLVEDNALNREIAVDLLTETGLLVEEAEDGSIAVDMLLKKGAGYYQLVIMDVQMPVMDGYTAARTIRAFKDPALACIPIIAMTANAFEEDKQKALAAGMNAHLAKPIEPELLLETLRKY